MRKIKAIKSFILAVIIIGISVASAILVVHADTDGNELRTTNQPDKFVILLGAEWAGAEFELKLDSGVFPVPLKTNESGVITMDLGGSKTYTLTLLQPVIEPNPVDTVQNSSNNPETEMNTEPPTSKSDNSEESDKTENEPEIETDNLPDNAPPVLPMILFLGGLMLAVSGLFVMRAMKKSREYHENDDEYEYGDE